MALGMEMEVLQRSRCSKCLSLRRMCSEVRDENDNGDLRKEVLMTWK